MENYRIVLLGDSSVGKSCLLAKFAFDIFTEYQEPTIGAAFMVKNIKINSTNVKIEIWDTAGQERYKSLAPMYYRAAEGAVIIYDITQNDSLKGATFWINEIKNKGNKNCICFLVGNKIDLESDRKIEKDIVTEYCEKNNTRHITTSAKTGKNVMLLFEELAKEIFENRKNVKKEVAKVEICHEEPDITNKCC
jgi:small GTP-binding protein